MSPNPVRRSARVSFAVAKAADVRVRVLDVQGRLVTELARGPHPPGRYEVTWTPPGRAAGLYFIRYEYPGGAAVRRVAIAR